jgi:hypothetical protein
MSLKGQAFHEYRKRRCQRAVVIRFVIFVFIGCMLGSILLFDIGGKGAAAICGAVFALQASRLFDAIRDETNRQKYG